MIDRTLFFRRDEHQTVGDGAQYSEYWWTYPGADDPYAPDEVNDPYASYRYGTDGKIKKFFLMGKIARDKWLNGKRKRNLVNILGTDWTIDTNDAFTGPDRGTYDSVEMTQRFAFLNDHLVGENPKMLLRRKSWERAFAELKKAIGGKTWKISTSNDRWFYREGRVEVEDAGKEVAGGVEIKADCDPWKYEKYSSMDTWLWDDLDFEYGIIREKADYTVTVAAYETKSIPIFPLEKIEPLWVRSTSGGESDHNRVALFFENEATAAYDNFTTVWKKTTKAPSPGHVILYVRNETHLPEDAGYEAHPVTIEIMYRGAMR